MLAYAREELGLQHAIATAYPQNLASLRVLHKAGMHPAPTRTDADGTVICCFAWHADAPPATEQPHGAAPAAGLAAE
jgi:RimJ/RimL family protein N-acetyltransferase